MVDRRLVELADVGIEIIQHDPAASQTATWFFGPDSGGARPRQTDVVIELGGDVRAVTDRPADSQDGPVRTWWAADSLHAVHESSAATDATDTHIVIGRPDDDAARWRSDRQLLFTALSWWFARRGAVVLHAAAIVVEDVALVIAGPTGAGKSTCVAAAIEQGWGVLSDDLVVIKASDRVRAFGVPKRVALDAEQSARLAQQSTPLADDQRMRRTLPVSFVRSWYEVGALVAVGHHAGEGDSYALAHRDAVATIMASWPESVHPEAVARGLPHIAALAGLPAFSLLHGDDPVGRVHRAAIALRSIGERCKTSSNAQ